MLNWDDITTVFLDMDGTLLDLNFDNYFWHEHVPLRFSELNSLAIEAAKLDLYARYRAMEGSLEWYCVDYWSRELALDIIQLKREIADRVLIFPEVEAFLIAVRRLNKRLVLLTNAHRRTIEVKFERTGLETYFDAVISSHDFGYAKENANFWPRLIESETYDAQKSLFIDDNLRVLNAARTHGIKYLISIRQPDSGRAEQDTGDYPAIRNFSEIMPTDNIKNR